MRRASSTGSAPTRSDRDIFARVLFGATDTLTVAPLATLIGLVAGTALGIITGYYAGSTLDDAVGRLIDALLALPLLVLAVLVIAATEMCRSDQAIVIGLAFVPAIARTVRAASSANASSTTSRPRRLQGERAAYIMAFEILPNVTGMIIVEGTVRLGYAIFAAASLRFLGFGPSRRPPTGRCRSARTIRCFSAGTLLVDGAVRRPRDRHARRRRPPDRGRPAAGARPLTRFSAR